MRPRQTPLLPPQAVMSKRQAKAGQQNEDPADALLPQVPGQTGVPIGPDAEQIEQIPHSVVEHHADEIQPPQLVQQGIAG